jgi:SsrA-binding protein
MDLAFNKQASFSYDLLEKFEAGIVLLGHEVKSVKQGQISLKSAYITIKRTPKPELYLINSTISKYQKAGSLADYNPLRERKLLVGKSELSRLIGKLEQKGLTLLPVRVYTKHNLVKLEIALGRGKKLFEKKEAKKQKDIERDTQRFLKTNKFQ